MQYPLTEKIGNPDLFVGREQEFQRFHWWIAKMPKRLSKSWALLGRRKSGKTCFVQRLFNEIWSANGEVIPFYISIPDAPIWYPDFSESKIAPMLATGSYVGWMKDIMAKYLEAGRLSHVHFSPYLSESEGVQAVYKYAEVNQEPITNETAVQISKLCMADPFFISCVMESGYPQRDLTTAEGVIETVNYEMADRGSELSLTWREYIDKTVDRINDQYGKRLLLHLSKYNHRWWPPRQLKQALDIEEDEKTIMRKLIAMVKGDLLEWGVADIDFRGLQDGTLNLILRHRFEKEMAEHQAPPDLRADFRVQIAELKKENQSLV